VGKSIAKDIYEVLTEGTLTRLEGLKVGREGGRGGGREGGGEKDICEVLTEGTLTRLEELKGGREGGEGAQERWRKGEGKALSLFPLLLTLTSFTPSLFLVLF